MDKKDIVKSIAELKKSRERKFNQSIDLIINLRNFNVKKENLNLFVSVPHKTKDVKVAAFLSKKNNAVDTICPEDFGKYKEKRDFKKLSKNYDFFISSAGLMPQVASVFGRYLGSAGKMPSPKLGIIAQETSQEIEGTIGKMQKVIRIKSKEPSLKLCIGKQNMKDEDIAENIIAVYKSVLDNLPKNKENIKNVMIKLTMGKPIKLQI